MFLDGVYVDDDHGNTRFHRVKAPTQAELTELVHTLSQRIARKLEKRGLLERDAENTWLTLEAEEGDALTPLQGASVTYRIATGPQQGRKVLTLQTLPNREDDPTNTTGQVAKVAGFSLHAGVMAAAHQRDKLERLCRYVSRPAVSEKRLSLTGDGKVRYQLKTPYRNGTTHVIFEPVDFIAKLAALVPKPRVNLTRFHGVFAPNSKQRIKVTPAKRGKQTNDASPAIEWTDKTPEERHRAMTWAQRLKRVFAIDLETCERCGGYVKVIASIADPTVIEHILKHLQQKDAATQQTSDYTQPPERAPPEPGLFDSSQTRLFD